MVLRTVLITIEYTRVLINIAVWNFRNRTAMKCLHTLIFSKDLLTRKRFVLEFHFIDESAEHIVGEQSRKLCRSIVFSDNQVFRRRGNRNVDRGCPRSYFLTI
ncbi:hypothetical protein D3C73_928530 [compost metagenome]